MTPKNWSINWGGRTLTVEVGRFALQANASCTVRYGDTVLMATIVMSKTIREGLDFFPLMVNFEEKLYAAGKIKGSRFIKREGRPSDDAILSGRLVDRSLRPLFDQRLRNDVQIILTALSFDGENDSQIPALIAASVVAMLSPVPFEGPIAGARVGRANGVFKLNPSFVEREEGDLDIIVAGTPEKLVMVEAACKDVPESDVLAAMQYGSQELAVIIDFIKKIQAEVGQPKLNLDADVNEFEAALRTTETEVDQFIATHVNDWIFDSVKKGKAERVAMVDRFAEAIKELLTTKEGLDEKIIKIIMGRVKTYVEKYISLSILEKEQRLDGRALTDIRPLNIEVALLPRTHGTGMFMRGDTQVLSIFRRISIFICRQGEYLRWRIFKVHKHICRSVRDQSSQNQGFFQFFNLESLRISYNYPLRCFTEVDN
jgi:polyribonucleotide nucleotidyltransferase